MEECLQKKRCLKGRLTRLATTVQALEDVSTVEINVHVKKLDQVADDMNELFMSINELCSDDEYVPYEEEFATIENKIDTMRVNLLNACPPLVPISPATPSVENLTISKSCDVKLPKLELPTFNGKFHEWISFKDLFVAAVHNNASLSGAQKLQYLKAAVKDEPARLINAVPLTDLNYIEAWDMLQARYQNNREIVSAHLDKFLSQPSIQSESSSGLRTLADTSAETIRSLRVLEVPVDHWDAMLTHIVAKKLDSESRRQWELSLTDDSIPTFSELHKFIDQRARALAAAGITSVRPPARLAQPHKAGKVAHVHHMTMKHGCQYCKKDHSIYKCDTFLKLKSHERYSFVKGKHLCFNCLRANHTSVECIARNCSHCEKKHHNLLHFDTTSSKSEKRSVESLNSYCANESKPNTNVILATALVKVKDSGGNTVILRALLDSASEASFITEHQVQQLKLVKSRTNTPVVGLSAAAVANCRSAVTFAFTSLINEHCSFSVNALALQKITGLLPNSNFNVDNWDHIRGLKLADPTFNKSNKIDVLLGADIFFTLLRNGRLTGPEGLPSVQETALGWIVAGKVQTQPAAQIKVHHSLSCTNDLLQKFWETEEVASSAVLSPEERKCEEHFKSTVTRNDTGRYVVKLPFKQTPPSLGISCDSAVARLKHTENKLARNPELKRHYINFMTEYLELNHMAVVPNDEGSCQEVYYMPHHPVLKEDSLSTKVRVVFDASLKSSNNQSLNDNLLVGPKLQPDLITILLRFRLHAIAVTADIEKMYRQVLVCKEDQDYQRIVWRTSPDESI